MNRIDKVIATVKALHARAADEASGEHEVMAAITRADKLMQDNDITLDDLKDSALRGGIIKLTWGKGTVKLHPVECVASAVIKLTETRGWIEYPDGAAQLAFVGFAADAEYAIYLVDLVHNAMESEWVRFRTKFAYAHTPIKERSRLREDFMRGMTGRVREKMMDVVAARRINAPDLIKKTGTELVVLAKREMVAGAVAEMGIDPRKRINRKMKRTVGATAYYAGRDAGERTTITTGIGVEG